MELSTCRVCGSKRTALWKRRNLDRDLRAEDFQITDSRYGVTLTLHKCADCAFIFADEAEIGQLTQYYEQMEDTGYEAGAENRAAQMRQLLQLGIKAHPKARTLLDVGAGSGLLAVEAARLGLDPVGVEPSKYLVESAKRTNGIQILQGTFPHPELMGRRFDLIYMVDVIEHVTDPVSLLASGAGALAPGGVLVIVTPDVSSLAARFLGPRWWHFRLAHVGYFNDQSMKEAASRAGLAIQSQSRARWFFPIRYLAERTAVYLPVGAVNRAAEKIAPLRRLYDCVIPLNLYDSTIFLMTRAK